MKWRGRRTSSNIEDRRGAGSGGLGRFRRMRGGRRVRMPGGRGKIGGLGLIIIVVLALAFGVDPTFLLQGTLQDGGGTGFSIPPGNAPSAPNRIDDKREEFVGVVLADTEEIWTQLFAASGKTYRAPRLVLFSGRTSIARATARPIWTWPSSRSWTTSLAPAVISPRPMSSPTRSPTMCRTNLG
jgi:predicted metalloprotease